MIQSNCLGRVCFAALDPQTPRFFGFAEFLTGLALLALAWTTADARYRFRVQTAPVPLEGLTFGVVIAVGLVSLATDLWRSEGWLVPVGPLVSSTMWQALLALVLFFTFTTWAWFAFIRPPKYGRLNAERFLRAVYRVVLNGNSTDLAIVAQELGRSARDVITFASERTYWTGFQKQQQAKTKLQSITDNLLLLMADRRLCRALVESAPGTIQLLFEEVASTKKYRIEIGTLARNLISEAIGYRGSFLYYESEGYESGLMGYVRPLSNTMFGNSEMVEAIRTLLDPSYSDSKAWDAEQWNAYCQIVLLTLDDHRTKNLGHKSHVLRAAMERIARCCSDLYKLDGLSIEDLEADSIRRLRVAVAFFKRAIELLEESAIPDFVPRRYQEISSGDQSVYDFIAEGVSELVFAAAAVRAPAELSWWVQHNSLWADLSYQHGERSKAAELVFFKLRRLIYNEIAEMRVFPNYKAAKYLSFCLNVFRLKRTSGAIYVLQRPLQTAVLNWTKRYFASLYAFNSRVAEACLVEGYTYEPDKLRIVKAYPIEGLRRIARFEYLEVDPASSMFEVH